MNRTSMMKIYYPNVFYIISYSILVYARGNLGNLDRIERLDLRILKIIFSEKAGTINDTMVEFIFGVRLKCKVLILTPGSV